MENQYPPEDYQFREEIVSVSQKMDRGWQITDLDGWSFWIDTKYGVEPKIGQLIRYYGKGLGYTVRGVFLDGKKVFYKTVQEEQKEFEIWLEENKKLKRSEFRKIKSKLDRQFANLPPPMRRRIKRFRKQDPDFRWEHESYEMFCCDQALQIAWKLKFPEAVESFAKLGYEQQRLAVPKLSGGHSGNTLGASITLAYWFLKDPDKVEFIHGALSPIVGDKLR